MLCELILKPVTGFGVHDHPESYFKALDSDVGYGFCMSHYQKSKRSAKSGHLQKETASTRSLNESHEA